MNEIDYMRRILALEKENKKLLNDIDHLKGRCSELRGRALAAESREAQLRNKLHECQKVIEANVDTLMWSDQAG